MARMGMTRGRSRDGKKQIVAYLVPLQADAVRDNAWKGAKTIQEVLGEAMNAVFEHHGLQPPMEPGHARVVRRVNRCARIRDAKDNPHCRTGRVAVGGWYEDAKVHEVVELSNRLGATIQSMAEFGIKLVTGASTEGDTWMPAAGLPQHGRRRGRPPGSAPRPLDDTPLEAEAVIAEEPYEEVWEEAPAKPASKETEAPV